MKIFKVESQGGPRIQHARIVLQTPDVLVVSFEMHTKYCEVSSICSSYEGEQSVLFGITQGTQNLNPSVSEDPTMVEIFPAKGMEYAGGRWGRYSIQVVYIRKPDPDFSLTFVQEAEEE